MKTCKKCSIAQEEDNFIFNRLYGLQSVCRSCRKSKIKKTCSIKDCNNVVAYRRYDMCDMHCRRMKRHGNHQTVKRINKYPITGTCLTCNIVVEGKTFCSGKCSDRASRIQSTYGISILKYKQMLLDQNRKCKICNREMSSVYVDHCHETKIVRGLLCINCNTMLGHARDKIEVLEKAIEYLSGY